MHHSSKWARCFSISAKVNSSVYYVYEWRCFDSHCYCVAASPHCRVFTAAYFVQPPMLHSSMLPWEHVHYYFVCYTRSSGWNLAGLVRRFSSDDGQQGGGGESERKTGAYEGWRCSAVLVFFDKPKQNFHLHWAGRSGCFLGNLNSQAIIHEMPPCRPTPLTLLPPLECFELSSPPPGGCTRSKRSLPCPYTASSPRMSPPFSPILQPRLRLQLQSKRFPRPCCTQILRTSPSLWQLLLHRSHLISSRLSRWPWPPSPTSIPLKTLT